MRFSVSILAAAPGLVDAPGVAAVDALGVAAVDALDGNTVAALVLLEGALGAATAADKANAATSNTRLVISCTCTAVIDFLSVTTSNTHTQQSGVCIAAIARDACHLQAYVVGENAVVAERQTR